MTAKKETATPQAYSAEDPCASLAAQVVELQTQLDNCRVEIETLRAQVEAKPKGIAGYMVRVPFAGYNGTTAGVQFRNGTAFLPDTENGKRTAQMLADEFGYSIERVDDYQALPEAPAIGRSLIDALVIPERR